MNFLQSNRLSVFLMTGSLLLLLLFLCFWLKNVYEEEYEALQKDTDYLFSGAIRTIEDELLEDLYGSPFYFKSKDSTGFSTIKIMIDQQIDTIDGMAFLHKEAEGLPTDSTFKMTVRSKRKRGNEKEIYGSLALAVAIHRDSTSQILGVDSLFNSGDDSGMLATLEAYVKKDMEAAGIPLSCHVIRLGSEEPVKKKLVSSSYTDLINGQSYVLEYDRYRPYLLQKMIPEFLFSFFLFSCITIAFFVVYRSLQQQRKLTQLKNDFVSNITHELKTPIATVGVAIEALSDFEVLDNPERTKEYLDISKHELNRLSLLVDKVLKMSLFEKKEPELKLEPLNINQLIQGILDTMKLQFEKLNAAVYFQPLEKEADLSGDKIHLTSVLYNLIDNALKYSSGAPEIKIDLEHTGPDIKLNIRDKGIGISPAYKDKIFEKFFRVPSGDQHNTKGYGLGLSYVVSVIEKHRGRIEVDSQPGMGSCFSIYLPKSLPSP